MTETGKTQEAGQKLEVEPAKQNILRLMEMEGQAMNQEEQHLQSCCQMIRENIKDYEIKVTKGRKETEELYAAVQSGQVELYNQLMVSLDIQEHNENALRKNKAALEKPYFGRVDYEELHSGEKESLYIGKNGITKNRTEVIIVDWRAPVSSVYYENELGAGQYEVPEHGLIDVDLTLKRTFDIDSGTLIGYYDNDVAANDELLVKYLAKNKDVVLGDIIATIQKEQNEIIREKPFTNVIVQGVAGSGKTTVAMHRISYILYNYENRFSPEEFCIIGSNDMLLSYITSGLPELDVHHVGQMKMDVFFSHMIGKEWKKKYTLVSAPKEEAYKSKMEFVLCLEEYLSRKRSELLVTKDIRDSRLGLILSQENQQETVKAGSDSSVCQLMKLLNDRIKSKIQFLTNDDIDFYKEKAKEYKNYYDWKKAKQDIMNIYLSFLKEYGEAYGHSADELMKRLLKGQVDVYDAASLALIQRRITEKEDKNHYGQIIIDEAQDFGVMVYYVLKKILPKCYFTIMGDVSQNIHYETGMNDWDELCSHVFEPDKEKFYILAKSYRNTIEISQYAGRVLERASYGTYKIQPVIRHGMEVQHWKTTKETMYRQTADIIRQVRDRGYDTTAVICRTSKEAVLVEEGLKDYLDVEKGEDMNFKKGVMVLPIDLTKGLEFDTVILWNPDESRYGENQGEAKLLYVAITRALHELHIIYSETLSKLFV